MDYINAKDYKEVCSDLYTVAQENSGDCVYLDGSSLS